MIDRLERHAVALGRRKVDAILDAVAAADLPAGLSAERGEGVVVISEQGLARRLAFDPRLSAIGLIARQA